MQQISRHSFGSNNNRNNNNNSLNRGWLVFITTLFVYLMREVIIEIHSMELFFIKLHTVYAFICQVCFFILCDVIFDHNDRNLLSPKDKNVIMAFTTVLFYSIFGYFAFKIRDVCRRNRMINIRTPPFNGYFVWFIKVILEWAKAIVIILCLKEQGLTYEPNVYYTIFTMGYYVCTEKVFIEIIPVIFEWLQFKFLDDFEHIYVPMLMSIYTILTGFIITLYSLYKNINFFNVFIIYFLIYLRLKDFYFNLYKTYAREKSIFGSFETATLEQINDLNDICAVCLNGMSRAKITPCNHFFHPECLKQCLKISYDCPLCKRRFVHDDFNIK